jgi:membrane-associated protein
MHLDPTSIIQNGGLILIGVIIFLESGMLVGFFLPGDTLLLSAGLIAAQGHLPIAATITVIAVAAIIGDNTGYMIGRLMGKRLFKKKDGILFRHEYVERAETFFERYGLKVMLISHYIPIVRSFAPLVAGVGRMNRLKFFIFDAIGCTTWAIIITLLGYWFGSRIPNLDRYILPTILTATIITMGPMLWHIFGEREARTKLVAAIKRLLRRVLRRQKHTRAD